MNQIYKFQPYLKPIIWGGRKIAAFKGIECKEKNIDKSWELSSVPRHESVVDCRKGLQLGMLIKKYGECKVVADGEYTPLKKGQTVLATAAGHLAIERHSEVITTTI
jgi:mannose-6-phosphate isomerase class I